MEGDQSAAKQGAAAMAHEAMAEDSTAAAAASTATNGAVLLMNLDLDAKVKDLLASYYGEAAFSAVAADLLKPCGEDWLASQVLEGEGEGEGEANRIQWEAVESMQEHYGAEPADEEAGG
eukprot:jgi/Tetstr1/440262/TSEL_028613.t1